MQDSELNPPKWHQRFIHLLFTVITAILVLALEWIYSDKLPPGSFAVSAALAIVIIAAVFSIEIYVDAASQRVINYVLLSNEIGKSPAEKQLRRTHTILLQHMKNASSLLYAEPTTEKPWETIDRLLERIRAMDDDQ